ncbi:hypothetical protein PG996_005100 [Apiospora saccharicola]|uniref:Uncharacterized protein n=1 Tax=Apiospora saccharicola TaxID=335842 RepID=A0ABR1VLM1_9PEZI
MAKVPGTPATPHGTMRCRAIDQHKTKAQYRGSSQALWGQDAPRTREAILFWGIASEPLLARILPWHRRAPAWPRCDWSYPCDSREQLTHDELEARQVCDADQRFATFFSTPLLGSQNATRQ